MKSLKITIIIIITIISVQTSFSQDITADTTLANEYYQFGRTYCFDYELDSALFYTDKAQKLYIKHLGEYSLKNADCLNITGIVYNFASEYDSSLYYFQKALDIKINILGENNASVAMSYNNIGIVYYSDLSNYDKALEYHQKALRIRLQIFGELNKFVAISYSNIAEVYNYKGNYTLASNNYFKVLEILQNLEGEENTDFIALYGKIGQFYNNTGEYIKAIEYFQIGLNIGLKLLEPNHPTILNFYKSIANSYNYLGENDKSLEYNFKALNNLIVIFGEKSGYVATSYANIGGVYYNKGEFNKSLDYLNKALNIYTEIKINEYDLATVYSKLGSNYNLMTDYENALTNYFKSLDIRINFLGENNIDVASNYNNIALIYDDLKLYEKALDYLQKALNIGLQNLENDNIFFADIYENIGVVYKDIDNYEAALKYIKNSLDIRLLKYGEKQFDVSNSYLNLGFIYSDKTEYNKALSYYQKSIASNLLNFNDTINIHSIPTIKNYLDWSNLLINIQSKAQIFADTTKTLEDITNKERLEIALKHYQACDTLITQARKEITTQSDKIALGEKASQVYKEAAKLSYELGIRNDELKNQSNNYFENCFNFSEKNKSSVLLESLAGSKALKFAGIPEELLEKEHTLSIDIALYTNLKNNAERIEKEKEYKDKLFNLNKTYDSLIIVFETNYPAYYNLKYNNSTATVAHVSNLLDKKTAMISYIILDSSLVVYQITKKGLEIYKTALLKDLDKKVYFYVKAMQADKKKDILKYKQLAFELYNQLFPKEMLENKNFQSIENLIIIPDGYLATVPFESLLTSEYTKEWTDWSDSTYFSEMPFLIKKYAISYTYSATLFCNTFAKQNTKPPTINNLNDWIAFAPVFDEENISGTTEITTKLLEKIDKNQTDSTNTNTSRGKLLNGAHVNALPGSLTEVDGILKMYENANLKAVAKTHKYANELFVKSGELENYKIIHFATHGFVNRENPELSGILLAQDTSSVYADNKDIYGNVAQQNDGILYQSEIYNLKLNSDLVVLSACETGLGKITTGEGVIGLSRALLYAGTKNLLVSLWQVSDASTSQLMLSFYDNLLADKAYYDSKSYIKFNKDLQKAKLKLIAERKYAHPYYWSPFVLIGQ